MKSSRLHFARTLATALAVASSGLGYAQPSTPLSANADSPTSQLEFKLVVRRFVEFRLGDVATVKSNAGQVVIRASTAGSQDPAHMEGDSGDRLARMSDQPQTRAGFSKPPNWQRATAPIPPKDRTGANHVCLYFEGDDPGCSDLRNVAGPLTFTAIIP